MERTKGTVEVTLTVDKFEPTSAWAVINGVGAIKCSYSCASVGGMWLLTHCWPFVQLVRQRLAFVSFQNPMFRAFLYIQPCVMVGSLDAACGDPGLRPVEAWACPLDSDSEEDTQQRSVAAAQALIRDELLCTKRDCGKVLRLSENSSPERRR